MVLVKSVAIIGAGPGGLAAAKYLVAEHTFERLVVFDARPSVGGTWCATPHDTIDKSFTIPRTKPTLVPNGSVRRNGRLDIISPVYDSLDTNIPHTLMNYSDLPFPEGTPLFPPHRIVREYLERYAEDIQDLLCLGTQVLDVEPVEQGWDGKWSIRTVEMETRKESVEIFDAVIVASGHYDDPFVPSITGINDWNTAFPGAISHSKFYRRPDDFRDKKVIIVGHSASGLDLANQISTVSQKPLIISERMATVLPQDLAGTQVSYPEISELIVDDRSVRFVDGHVEKDVDSIIFCTGYMYSYPFLKSLVEPVVGDGSRVLNLYQQIFYHPIPTLSFIGLPQRIVPLPVSEAQSAVIARFLSGRLNLPSQAEMRIWEAELVTRTGGGKNVHTLKFPLDARYINELHNWSAKATRRAGLAAEGVGKIPPYWDEEKQWMRERFPMIKEASRKLGQRKDTVTTLAQLGFDFLTWKESMEGAETGIETRPGVMAEAKL